jgi:NADP-dependent 3-hydroxy acid dehydrogenase YdfG
VTAPEAATASENDPADGDAGRADRGGGAAAEHDFVDPAGPRGRTGGRTGGRKRKPATPAANGAAGAADDGGARSGRAAAGGTDDSAARARADARAVVQRAAARRRRPSDGIGAGPAAPSAVASPNGPAEAATGDAGDGAVDGATTEAPTTRGLLLVGPGASFGVQLVRRFAREGFATAVISRSPDTVSRVCGAFDGGGGAEGDGEGAPVLGAVADVTDPPAFGAAVARLAAAMGGLTVLVYNAKLSIRSNALTVAADTLNQTLAVNVTGALTAVQAAVPLLADRPGATILLTSAGARTQPPAGRFALAVGKAGLAALGGALVAPLQSQGVRLRTVVLDGQVDADGPLTPDTVADHFWQAYAAPRGTTFRLAPDRPRAPVDQLPFSVRS